MRRIEVAACCAGLGQVECLLAGGERVSTGSLEILRSALAAGQLTPRVMVEQALAHSNSNAAGNVYLAGDLQFALREADDMLWECAYAEMIFTDQMWPDFEALDLEAALQEFQGRDRRFGHIAEQVTS